MSVCSLDVTKKRDIIVQLAYEADIKSMLNDEKRDKLSSEYFQINQELYDNLPQEQAELNAVVGEINNIIENSNEIDAIISENLNDNWKINRLPKVVLAILRVAIKEIHRGSYGAIEEIIPNYLKIAKKLGHEKEIGFINGILDKIAKKAA